MLKGWVIRPLSSTSFCTARWSLLRLHSVGCFLASDCKCWLLIWTVSWTLCKLNPVRWDFRFFSSNHFHANCLQLSTSKKHCLTFCLLLISLLLSCYHFHFLFGIWFRSIYLSEMTCGSKFTFRLKTNASYVVLLSFGMSFVCFGEFQWVFRPQNIYLQETICERMKEYHFFE